jgi:hypothetical protein
MMLTTLAIAVLAAPAVAPAAAEEKNMMPKPDAGNVTLTLDEFNRLNELAAKPLKRVELPPTSYSLKRADFRLKVEEDLVTGTIVLQGEVLVKGMVKVPLTTGMTILNAHQDGRVIPIEFANGTQTAILSGPSEFTMTLDAALPLHIEAGRAVMSLPVPACGSSTLTLAMPGDHTTVNIAPGLITNHASEGAHTAIEATLVPGEAANLSWATRETGTPAAAREVRYLADVKTLVTVREAELSLAALADITVVQGEPEQFAVEIPEGYEVTGATGPTLDSNEVQGNKLLLHVTDSSERSHEFLITMERSLGTATSANVPMVSFDNAQRETGELLVEGAGTLELTGREGTGLKRMDVKEANAYLRSLAHFPPQAAYRYHKQAGETPSLALEWVRFPDSSVLAAVAESAVVTTMVTSEGKSLTEVRLTVKNQAQPFLKVDLPPGATILSADVAGEKVKPVEGPDGNRVPLLRPGFRPTGTYEVSFVFLHSGTPFARKGGSELALPPMDVPIDMLAWEVFLPEQYKVKDFGGDVVSADLMTADVQNGGFRDVGTANAVQAGVAGGVGGGIFHSPINDRLESMGPGQISGTVTDQTGAAIPGARVTVTIPATAQKLLATANVAGTWVVSGVPSGTVHIAVSANGFQTLAQNLSYNAQGAVALAQKLSVGASANTVEVESENAEVSGPISQKEVSNMALNGRNFTQLTTLSPGTANTTNGPVNGPSQNVVNLQRRVAGVLPVTVDVPRAGTAFHFVRPLVVAEETKVTFAYKSR